MVSLAQKHVLPGSQDWVKFLTAVLTATGFGFFFSYASTLVRDLFFFLNLYLNDTTASRKSGKENDILMTFFTGLNWNELLHFNKALINSSFIPPSKGTVFLCPSSCLSVCIVELWESFFSPNFSRETMALLSECCFPVTQFFLICGL